MINEWLKRMARSDMIGLPFLVSIRKSLHESTSIDTQPVLSLRGAATRWTTEAVSRRRRPRISNSFVHVRPSRGLAQGNCTRVHMLKFPHRCRPFAFASFQTSIQRF